MRFLRPIVNTVIAVNLINVSIKNMRACIEILETKL